MDKSTVKTNKIVSHVDEAVKIARGERLKKVRNLANLSRDEFCERANLSINTFKTWEAGRIYGLSKEGAALAVDIVAKENVLCSIDWLLNGTGIEPIVIYSNPSIQVSDKSINKELTIFQAIYQETGILYTEIKEPLTDNFCRFGDVIVGIKVPLDNATVLIGQICLVETAEKNVLAVRLLKKIDDNKFLSSDLMGNEHKEITLLSIARFTRLYRPV